MNTTQEKKFSRRRCAAPQWCGVFLLVVSSCGTLSLAAQSTPPASESARWEKAIRAFEAQDRAQPPARGGVLFLGSSSIRLWDLPNSFAALKSINRGFGGSQISDCIEFAPRILFPYEPQTVVFYAGDNDIAAGKSAEVVARDYRRFVALVHERLPRTRVVFISIKPSIKRWHLIDRMRQANRWIREFSTTDPRLEYVDIDTPMLDAYGKPRFDFLDSDGLHLSPAGYALWASRVRPHLLVKSVKKP